MTDDDAEDAEDILDHPAGRRESGNVDILVVEAELVAEGAELDNPARPSTADVAEAVVGRLDEDQRPAWEVCG